MGKTTVIIYKTTTVIHKTTAIIYKDLYKFNGNIFERFFEV